MPRGPQVRVEGAKELRKALKAVDDQLPKEMAGIHRDVAEPVTEGSKGRVPRRTGALASTIKGAGTQTMARVQAGGAGVPYAGVIHYGSPSKNIDPQPFMTDALAASESVVVDIYEKGVDSLLARIFGRS